MRPHRTCALCDKKIRQKERLCPKCLDQWGEHLTSEWLVSLIQETNYQYNLLLRDYGRTISLEIVKAKL